MIPAFWPPSSLELGHQAYAGLQCASCLVSAHTGRSQAQSYETKTYTAYERVYSFRISSDAPCSGGNGASRQSLSALTARKSAHLHLRGRFRKCGAALPVEANRKWTAPYTWCQMMRVCTRYSRSRRRAVFAAHPPPGLPQSCRERILGSLGRPPWFHARRDSSFPDHAIRLPRSQERKISRDLFVTSLFPEQKCRSRLF